MEYLHLAITAWSSGIGAVAEGRFENFDLAAVAATMTLLALGVAAPGAYINLRRLAVIKRVRLGPDAFRGLARGVVLCAEAARRLGALATSLWQSVGCYPDAHAICGAKPVGAGDLGERPLCGRKRTIPFDASAVPYAPIALKKSARVFL
jgi:hypothetical protein